jgi:hypothetical protein
VITAVPAALAILAGAAHPVKISGVDNTWRWSFVEQRAVVHAEPSGDAPVVTTLRTRTPEGTHNLVPTIARVPGWVKVRLPILPNNSTGWVRREKLGGYEVVRTKLFVNRRTRRLRLEDRGKTVFKARIGVGQSRWPTPGGQFYVRNELRKFRSPVYGPVAFGTSARSAVLTDWPGGGFIGIHGTNEPGLIPGAISHGCIRLRNGKIRKLVRMLPVGTPIRIR